MKRERDQHQRLRHTGGRLSALDAIHQEILLAKREITLAEAATDLKGAREHITLAKKFVAELEKKVERLKP